MSAVRRPLFVALTLLVLTAAGCERVTDFYCRAFPGTEHCCTRSGGVWSAATRSCGPPPIAFPTS